MRPIDADALISFIDMGHLRNPLEACYSERDVVDMLESRPTITMDDLRPQGLWKLADDGDGVVCSECGTDFCILVYATDDFHFCPNCGADMRGGGEDG